MAGPPPDDPPIEMAAEHSSAAVEPPFPRVRLHHFFVLTAVMAAILGVSGPSYSMKPFGETFPNWIGLVITGWGIIYAVLASIAITITGYGIAWRRQGIQFFDQPGHWLLVEIAISSIFAVLPQLAFRLVGGPLTTSGASVPWTAFTFIWSVSLLSLLFRLGLNIYIGLKKCIERRWKWVFYLKAIAAVLYVFGDMLVLVMVSRAAYIDRREVLPRDMAHRCGVAVQIGIGFLTLSLSVFFMLWMSFRFW